LNQLLKSQQLLKKAEFSVRHYIENIEFFSRDDAKAGLSLSFNYELIDGKWNHSGKSSKGDSIHEIWSLRE